MMNKNQVFADRREAGEQLAKTLMKYNSIQFVVAVPRGGVPVGYEIADAFNISLDVVVVRKMGAPFNPELGIGAIAPDDVRVLDDQLIEQLGISDEQIVLIESRERAEMVRRAKEYRESNTLPDVAHKTVALVDDGMATGISIRAAVKALLAKQPYKLIVAVPVCALDTACELKQYLRSGIDETVCLNASNDFRNVGSWFQDFSPLSDNDVLELLNRAKLIK